MYDYLMGAINGTLLANFLVLLLGLIASVAVGIVLHLFVLGKKNVQRSQSSEKFVKFQNGERFLPLSFIKITYYSLSVYLIFMGIAQIIMSGYTGINGFIQNAVIGNIILRIAYECVLAVRKNAGIDTDNNTADEPKVNQPMFQPQYQSYQQPAPAPAPVPAPQPAPAPAPVPQPAPAPAPIPQPVPEPAPVPAPVELAKSATVEPIQPAQPVQPVQPEAPAVAFCGRCGKQIKADAKFCPFCGTPRN